MAFEQYLINGQIYRGLHRCEDGIWVIACSDNPSQPILVAQDELEPAEAPAPVNNQRRTDAQVRKQKERLSYYQRNTRPLYGKTSTSTKSVGIYEMDATEADVYLVSRYDRTQTIGRPIIYMAVDRATQLIAGIYVGLNGGEEAVIECLRNAVCDKVLNCLWQHQYTVQTSELTESIRRKVYELTGGIPALMSQSIMYAQQYAIQSGEEHVDENTLVKAAAKYSIRGTSTQTDDSFIMTLTEPPLEDVSVDESVLDKSSNEQTKIPSQNTGGRPKAFRDENDLICLFDTDGSDGFFDRLNERGLAQWLE